MVYPRVAEIIDSSAERASRLARESRPLHRVVPLRRKMYFVEISLIFVKRGMLILTLLAFQRIRPFLSPVIRQFLLLTLNVSSAVHDPS